MTFKDAPAINDRGDVLFQAGVNASDGSLITGLFLSRHGEIRAVVDSTGAFGDFGGLLASTRGARSPFREQPIRIPTFRMIPVLPVSSLVVIRSATASSPSATPSTARSC